MLPNHAQFSEPTAHFVNQLHRLALFYAPALIHYQTLVKMDPQPCPAHG